LPTQREEKKNNPFASRLPGTIYQPKSARKWVIFFFFPLRRQSSPSRTPQQGVAFFAFGLSYFILVPRACCGVRLGLDCLRNGKKKKITHLKTKVFQGWFRISAPPESEDRSEVEPKNEERQSMGLPPRKKGQYQSFGLGEFFV
jgi:hypothetical protein